VPSGDTHPRPTKDLLLGHEVTILINKGNPWHVGEQFADWTSLEIVRSMARAVGTFRIDTAHSRPWPLRPEVDVSIDVAGHPALRGHVDSLKSSVSGDRKTLTFAGRDLTSALVDCSAMNEPGEWRGLTVRKIIEAIAEPLGVTISGSSLRGNLETDKIEVFKLQPGERAFTAIDRAARLRGLLTYAYGDGTLRIATAGQDRAGVQLLEGEQGNILSSEINWSHVDRFSEYRVRGQSTGSDEGWGAAEYQPEGLAHDPEVLRYRPLLVIAEGQIAPADAATRAEWEASFRASRAARLKVVVQGWTKRQHQALGDDEDTEDELWRVNELIACTIPSQGFENEMLIDTVRFRRSGDAGTTTELTLVRLDAYEPKPVVDQAAEPFGDFLGELDE